MLVPTVHTPTASNNDHVELATALRLLAGFECRRDAQQAHTMLVRLTESRQRLVAEDARAVLQEGLRKDWFGERKPFYQDLVTLAERTAGGKKDSAASQLIIALAAGLVAAAVGIFFFLSRTGSDVDPPYLALAVGVLIIVLGGLFALKR